MKRTIIGIFVFLTVLYAILSLIFAVNGYPCFRQDAICFLPTSYFINHQHQLINPFYDAGIDPVTHKFLFYPPLFPYAIAFIIKLLPATSTAIHIALAIINLASILIIFISAYVYIKKNVLKEYSLLYLFLIIWAITLFSFHSTSEGRPEILSNFLITCFILNNIYKSKRCFNFINGILIGLNILNSPISTFYLIIITAGILFYNNNFKVKSVLQTTIGFVFVFGCFAMLYPYKLVDLYHGLVAHSTRVVINRDGVGSGSDRLKWIEGIYFTTPFNPLAGISFLVSIFYTLYLTVKRKKITAIMCLSLLLASISYFAFKNVLMAYNLYVLSPIFIFLILVFFIDILNNKFLNLNLKASFCILTLLLFINSLGFFRTAVLFFSTQNKEVPISDVEKEITLLSKKLKKDKKIYITFSLWPACFNKTESIICNTPLDNPVIQYIVFQQSNSGQSTPPEIVGFKMIKNGFISDDPRLFKIKIGNTYPYYQTSIYEKQ